MKATPRTTRWLLIALLFGLLATAGFTLTQHHGDPTAANAQVTAAPMDVVPQQHHAGLLAATGGKPTPKAHAGAHFRLEFVHNTHSNVTQPHATGSTNTPSNTSIGVGGGWGHQVAATTGGSADGPQPQGNDHPATSGTNSLPQNGAGEYAYAGYAPLDCELPAGCGGMSGGTSYGGRQPSGTSGALPFVHDSQGSSNAPSGPGPQTNDNTPDTNNTSQGSDPPGQNSDPPATGTNPPVAFAPELDPATLFAAVTLLFGALAVLLSRRVRAKH